MSGVTKDLRHAVLSTWGAPRDAAGVSKACAITLSRAAGLSLLPNRSHVVAAQVVGEVGKTKRLEQRGKVGPEAATVARAQPIPTTERVLR